MSGVVGKNKFTFDIWGDAVNTAALMEANGAPGRVNISETVAGHVKTLFELEPRGPVVAKHDRSHEMFFLNRLKPRIFPRRRRTRAEPGLRRRMQPVADRLSGLRRTRRASGQARFWAPGRVHISSSDLYDSLGRRTGAAPAIGVRLMASKFMKTPGLGRGARGGVGRRPQPSPRTGRLSSSAWRAPTSPGT